MQNTYAVVQATTKETYLITWGLNLEVPAEMLEERKNLIHVDDNDNRYELIVATNLEDPILLSKPKK
jgi:hypothetical protein